MTTSDDRIHRAVSADGTEIAGRVEGQGPPLVLVHGAFGDGDIDWEAMLPLLRERFTCFLPSTRGRGLSGDNPDHSAGRIMDDVRAFVESIGEPVGVVSWSGGAMWSLGAAAGTDAIAALAVYEPPVYEVLRPSDVDELQGLIGRMGELAAEDRLDEALGVFFEWVATDDELAAFAELDDDVDLDAGARYVPVDLDEISRMLNGEGPSPTDPATLARIRAPVLIMLGAQTSRWFANSARHVVEHAPHAVIEEIPDIAHLAPAITPDVVSRELVRFLRSTLEAA